MNYKLFQKMTAKDIASLEGVSTSTAKADLKDIKADFGLKKVRFVHYLIYNKILNRLDVITNMDDTLNLESLKASILV